MLTAILMLSAFAQGASSITAGAAEGSQSNKRTVCTATGRNLATLPYMQLMDGARPAGTQTLPRPKIPTWVKQFESATRPGGGNAGNGGGPRGYTRLSLRYTPCQTGLRSYSKESRDPLSRWWMGKSISKVLKVKANIAPTDLKASMSLASISRNSGRKGDVWTTEISNERLLLPYFRIDNSSNVMLEFEFIADEQSQFGGASDALKIINRAAAIISPSTALVTSENIGRFNDSAQFVDQSVSELLRISITERLSQDSSLDALFGGNELSLATLILYSPQGNKVKTSAPAIALGTWEIVADRVIESIFVPLNSSSDTPSAAAVMNFRVAENKTLNDALSEEEAVANARDALVKAADGFDDHAAKLCSAVAIRADGLGLSPADVGHAMKAYAYLQSPGGKAGLALSIKCSATR